MALKKKAVDHFGHWKTDFLISGLMPEIEGEKLDQWFFRRPDGTAMLEYWNKHRGVILEKYIYENPGKRPWAWWAFESTEPRKRIGGKGTPLFEVLSVAPTFKFGIPTSYVNKFLENYYNGRFKSTCQWTQDRYEGRKTGDFKGVALDPNDPPLFESQAACLKRHGLLSKSEEKRLSDKDFEPETCTKHVKIYK